MVNKNKFSIAILLIAIMAIVAFSGCTTPTPTATPVPATPAPAPQKLMLGTTTSTYDSGLLDVLLPPFEKANNVKIQILSKGSGEAMKLGETGDVDVLIVHSPAAEDVFMAAGHGWNRSKFMHNDYIIIGPRSDPAGIKGDNATIALKMLADKQIKFLSRGDYSGTNAKEISIWNNTGIAQPSNKTSTWYVSTGRGMADTLTMAEELQAYTLTDKSTYLSKKNNMTLVILVEGDKNLFNPYSIITVNQTQHPNINYEMAKKLVDYVSGAEGQGIIKTYGMEKYGMPLFFPDIIK